MLTLANGLPDMLFDLEMWPSGEMINARHNSRHKHWSSFANFNTRVSKTVYMCIQ